MKKGLVITVIVMLFASMLCFAGGSNESEQTADKLEIWGLQAFNTEGDEYIANLVKQFGEEHGIEAEYTVVTANILDEKLAAAFEAGTPPDLWMQVGGKMQYYIGQGLTVSVEDVVDYMRSQEGGIFENLMSLVNHNGEAYGIPLEVDILPMHIRKDLLDSVGMDIPQTWDEFREFAKAVTVPPYQYGFGLPISDCNDSESEILSIIWSYGGAYFDEEGNINFDTPETRAALQMIADMYMIDKSIPSSALTWDDSGNNSTYQTGESAAIMNAASVYSWLEMNDPEKAENTLLIPAPAGTGPNARPAGEVNGFCWGLSAQSDNHEIAKEFLRYFFEPSNYEKLIEVIGGRWLPIYKNLLDSEFWNKPAYSYFKQLVDSGLITSHATIPSPLSSAIYAARPASTSLQRIIVDGMSVAEATALAQSEMEAIAETYN